MATNEACGSDGLVPSCCGPCNNVKKNSEATMFCVECNDMLCDTCVGIHRMFPTMKSHKIVVQTDKEQYEFRIKLLTDKCEKHDGKHLETFCKQHNELCCSVCVSLNHRHCDGLVYLPEYAGEKDAEKFLADGKLKLQVTKADAERLKTSRQAARQRAEVKKAQAIKAVDDYRERLIAEIERIHGQSITDITSKFENDVKAIETDVNICDDVIAEVNEAQNTLHDVRNDKVQSFIGVSRVDAITGQLRGKLDSTSENVKESIVYSIQLTVEAELKKTSSFGKFAEGKYEISIGQKIGEHVLPNETGQCDINKVEIVDQQLLLADWANRNLKICDSHLRILKTIPLQYNPRGFCLISNETICVSYQFVKKIQIVSLHESGCKVTRTIDIGRVCRGVCYKNGSLYVACGEGNDAEVQVYSTKGTLENTLGKRQLSAPYSVNTNQEGTTVFVGDDNKGVIAINTDGTLLWTYNVEETLRGAWDIAVNENNDLYVCEFSSGNIVKVTSDGQSGEVLLKDIRYPKTICYDKTNKRFIIAYDDNNILVHEVIKQRK